MQRNSTCSSAGDCFFFGIPTEGHVQSAIDLEYFWLWLLQPCCNPCVYFQDEQGTIFDDIDTGSVVNGDASNGSAPNPAVAAPIPPLWCRWIVYLLCLAAVSPHVLTIVWLTCLRKGPIDRVAFPAANATVSPFQQLGQYIMILGQKIDSAQELKDTLHKSCLYHCLFICVSWFFCFFLARRSWTSTLQHMEKQKSYLVLLECMMLDIFVFHALAIVTSRLADGMGTPLHKLQTVYTQMVNMQGEAMAEAPTRPCLWTLIAWPCFLAISQFKYLFSSCLRKCVTREKMDALSKHYVTCTKEDTMMNVWLVRAKCDPYWSMFVKIAF